ncbi:MAG: hypothetical protein K0S96_1198 [Geminicoccaceae bacterium]|nr:hypothetical protein [Geminicoccaceae bacterium]
MSRAETARRSAHGRPQDRAVRNSGRATTAMRTRAAAARTSSRTSVGPLKPWPCPTPTRTRNGSVARSWNSRMPTASRPCWLPSSPSSDSCLRVIAVDDMATTPPMTIPACKPRPRKIAAVAPISVVSPTCRPPAPKTVARAAINFGSSNSSPIMNIRSTTSSSERNSVPSLGARSSRPCGPIARPATR